MCEWQLLFTAFVFGAGLFERNNLVRQALSDLSGSHTPYTKAVRVVVLQCIRVNTTIVDYKFASPRHTK